MRGGIEHKIFRTKNLRFRKFVRIFSKKQPNWPVVTHDHELIARFDKVKAATAYFGFEGITPDLPVHPGPGSANDSTFSGGLG